MNDLKFSALIPVYFKESSVFLSECLESLKLQTLQADEIVIVEDGPITQDLDVVIKRFANILPIKRVTLNKNYGLGVALAKGVEECQHPIIARMDADDISTKDRFEKQLSYLSRHPECSIVGTWIAEFDQDKNNITGERRVPKDNIDLREFALSRNPLNHMSVVFRKKDILEVGNYKRFDAFEDYFLWVRLIMQNKKIANIQENLIYARTGSEMIRRRRGMRYLKQEFLFQVTLLNMGFNNLGRFLGNLILRCGARLLPIKLLKQAYNLMRNESKS